MMPWRGMYPTPPVACAVHELARPNSATRPPPCAWVWVRPKPSRLAARATIDMVDEQDRLKRSTVDAASVCSDCDWSRVFTTSSGVTSNVVASVPTDADRIRPSNDTWGWCGSVAGLKQDSSRWCRPRFIPGRGTTRPPSVATGRVAAQPYDPHAPRTRGNCEESITS